MAKVIWNRTSESSVLEVKERFSERSGAGRRLVKQAVSLHKGVKEERRLPSCAGR